MKNLLLVLTLVLAVSAAADKKLPLTLPPILYAVPGVECNVYFADLALTTNPANYAFDVECPVGRNDATRWRFTPTEKDLGSHPWTLKVYDESNQLVASGSTTVQVSPADAGTGRKIGLMVVGDSLTDFGYPASLRELLDLPGNPDTTFLGTNGGLGKPPGRHAHEGYAGWTWNTFLTLWTDNPAAKYPKSKFLTLKDGKVVLDFQAYCDKNHQGRTPDFITVMLGTNEMICTREDRLERDIDGLLAAADKLIAEFKRVAPQARIGVVLTPPPAASQDAFGANYNCGLSRWQYRCHQFRLVERLLEHFAKNKDDISVIPVYCGLDTEENFPKTKVPLSARNPTLCERLNNGVHPATPGYRQISDCIYAWLKYQLSQKPGN